MLNDPTAFREEMIDGFVAAFGRYVRRVPGASGIAAVGAPQPGKVAVVVGGGSGHYPAFYGLVGAGLADAAAIGDVFTSPSGEQAYRVGRAVDGGAGVLFTFGNYSGDVMNFAMAASRLATDGIDSRTVLVTDDVLSASAADNRRGIAGGFFVFKAAGAAAARGDDLSTVEALARRANARTRSVGVAFAGCTIPGQDAPLFTVEQGMMEVGLGIHGEPGVRTSEQLPAREIARLMVDTLLAEAPPDAGEQVAVLVNGLGGTKYEELFVLFHGIGPLLAGAGLELHEPLIGEFVTSLEMAGCSLTLCWLDDELRALLDATASTPAFTRIGPQVAAVPSASTTAHTPSPVAAPSFTEAAPVDGADASGGEAGIVARRALAAALAEIEAAEAELGRLDAAVGDGDHGLGMSRGFRAAVAAVDGFAGSARATLQRAGAAFQNAAGGASGALVGGGLIAAGDALPTADDAVDAAALGRALEAARATIVRLGQAEPGDKTMLDTVDPFVAAFTDAVATGQRAAAAWATALPAAEAGMRATTEMISRRGRASRLGERSRGHQDAGATSLYLVLRAIGATLAADR